MEDKDKVKVPYVYDTPIGIVEKQGMMFRGMATYDPKRPFIVKVLAIFFSLCILVAPGLLFLTLTFFGFKSWFANDPYAFLVYQLVFGLFLGIILFTCGIIAIYQNLRK